MKIVKPSVTLVHYTSDPERVIERMGRICYQSNHKVAVCGGAVAAKLSCINGRLPNHLGEPSFEACPRCEGWGTDISSAIAFVKMVLANDHESVIEHASAGFLIVADCGVAHEIALHRLEMLDRGVSPQIARSVLPNSLKSEIGMTANFREWRHFLRLRTSPEAHPQMREIAEMIRAVLLKISPACFGDIS
jgi:thymidylate synthase ThyX